MPPTETPNPRSTDSPSSGPETQVSGFRSQVFKFVTQVSGFRSQVSIPALLRTWLPLALFSILWLDLIRLLSGNWEAREQYSYGWFVPVLALGLFLKKWPARPQGLTACDSQPSTLNPQPPRQVLSPGFLLSAFCFLLCLLLLPLRVIFEINADWPLIAWVYTPIVVALTLYAIHLADPLRPVTSASSGTQVSGFRSQVSSLPTSDLRPLTSASSGTQVSGFRFQVSSLFSPWVRHFWFPVALILVALVWPYRIEKALTQGLMQVVAAITVEILGWAGIPAFQRGNLIEISTGVLGIDEACSGIRSLQSTLMVALFLGELYLLRWPIRLAFVVGGLFLAFCFNVVRTLFLTWEANKSGLSAVDKWHDPAGFTIAIATFFCLWGIALLVRRRWSLVPSSLGPLVSGPSAPRPLVPRYLLALGLWSVLCIAATEAWYHVPVPEQTTIQWTVQLPTKDATFKEISIPASVRKSLAYDSAITGKWQEAGAAEWVAYFFQWKAGSIQSSIRARGHRPEICLPAAGIQEVYQSETELMQIADVELPVRKYTFQVGRQMIQVFFVLWQNGATRQVGIGRLTQSERLDWVMNRRKMLGQQTLELILTGYASLEEAEQAVRARLPSLIKIETPAAAE